MTSRLQIYSRELSDGGATAKMATKSDLDALVVQVEGLDLEENRAGSGAYGCVFRVTVNGRHVIAKKVHHVLLQKQSVITMFRNECRILSVLHHPNIVCFIGVHYGRDKNDISLIMERLHSDLADFVETHRDTNIATRIHILYDVSKGLHYLHSLIPPLMHRDLTAPNILLTEDLTAKIGDLGTAKYVDLERLTQNKTQIVLTNVPGNPTYMPPECLVEPPTYTTKLDIFSFGHLIIHTVIGDFPKVKNVPQGFRSYFNSIRGKEELMRRSTAVHGDKMGEKHALYPLVVSCLHDRPQQRPSVDKVIVSLRKLCLQHPRMEFLDACKTDNVGVVLELLECGADPNQADKDGATAVHWASRKGHYTIVRVLLAAKATVNTQNKSGETPLWTASFNGHQICMELLIDAGANVDVPKEDGSTALIVAAWNGHVRAVELLIVVKAKIDIQQKDGATALYIASENGHCGVVRMLLEAKADVHNKTNNNQTALYVASRNGHDEIVRVLLAAKATVNTQTKSGKTPLWVASFNGHQTCMELLINAGANVDVPKEMTTGTPEYKAICSCRVDLTERLSNCFKDVAEYLSQSGALTGKQCQTIISAEMLLNYVLVDIKDPDTTLDAFAYFVTAMKQSGNTFFKVFVKKQIEAKRKEFYRELLQVPPGFQASQEYDVFISYSREADTMRTVDTLMLRLKQEGLTVFVCKRRIRPGDKWRSEIASAIKTCKAFVCVLTKRYVRSVYCNGELYEAEALGKPLFPVVCEDGWEDVPGGAPVTEVVRDFQYVSLVVAEDRENQLTRLVQSIKEAVPVAPGSSNLPTDHAWLVNKATTQLSEHTLLTQDEIGALQKLIEGTEVNIDDIIATGQGITLEEAQQLLAQKGYIEDAGNLKTRLQEIAKEQQRYLEILEDLMTAADTIDLRYLKLFLVGPPNVGKTTTLSRLLKIFDNIRSAGDKAKLPSTLLANCIQAFAFVGDDTAEWLSSINVDDEAKILFNYFCGNNLTPEAPLDTPLSEQLSEELTTYTAPEPSREQSHVQQDVPHKLISVQNIVSQVDKLKTSSEEQKTCKNQRISEVVSQFQKLIMSGDYSTLFNALGTFLNINDIGGQPGFLEMLPALSTGPAMYLVFLDLSKELNKPYKIPFSRDDTIITPYDAIHTVKDTVSQILSSISSIHSNPHVTSSFRTDKVDGFNEKLESFLQVSPLAALIGTHKDKLEHPEKEIKKKSEDLNDIVKTFEEILICPGATSERVSLFTVDNYTGTEQSDIAPLRNVLSEIFHTRFKDASLPIKPKWLLFGLILRREYKIATIEDCLELGKKLEMDENETKFCLRYLHDCVGTVMHYTSVLNDKKNWLKNRVICSPQVVFNSISQLILPSLRVLHSGSTFTFTEYERKELIRMGQYSAEAIEMYCKTAQVSKKLGNDELIPAKNLISLLQHLNLHSEIIHKDVNDPSKSRITYLMPAILECASQEELTNPPPPDANNPEPLLITFSCGYVPTGAFCGLITRLVSQGPHGILGLTWELVENGVKRNCVSFFVARSNRLTLLAHDQCYEIQVIRCPGCRMSLHDLCTYVFSVMLYTLKSLYPHLVPQIAFQCPCPGHKSSRDNLCVLTEEIWVQFLCGSKLVTPTKHQQVWLGKTASIGLSASLEVLQFMKGQSLKTFSFNWSKVGDDDTQLSIHHSKPNMLTFQSVSEEDLDYYQCEVKEAGKVVLTVYRALYEEAVAPLLPLSPVPVAPVSSNLPIDQAGKSSSVIEDVCKETGVSDHQLDQEIPERHIILLAEKFPHLLSVHKALTINDLQHVYEKLHTAHESASPHWFNLGLALGLTHFILTNIDSKHHGDNVSSLREMLAELLRTKDVTWSLLSDGLKKPTVKLINLADSVTATTPNLLDRLNLTPADLGDVTDVTRHYGNQAGVAYALRVWQRVNPSRATFRALVEIAIGLRRGDTAVDICRFIVKELN
ncbi:uncharacterized protein LOC135347138 isoform X2 [Halichondria panicea]|uniref:uncharacterized protein LOC135347138 isoform X2 n=1 Tax=Halichondria panicea TaxID=6063 RepID=UPI00312BCB16